MIIRVIFGIFVVAAFLCFPTPFFGLGPFLSMLMTAYLAGIVAAIMYLQSTMICRDNTYPRNGKLNMADKEKLLPIIASVLFVLFTSYNALFHYNYGPVWILPFFLLICFLFVLAEELIFRNFLFYVFVKHKVKVHHAILICAGLFACMHTFRYIDQARPLVMIYHFVFAFLIGVVLGSLFVISRNVLFVTITSFLIRLPIFGYALNHTVLAGKKTNFLLQINFPTSTIGIVLFCIYLVIAVLVAVYYYKVIVREYTDIKRLTIPRYVYSEERMEYLTNRYIRASKESSSSLFS